MVVELPVIQSAPGASVNGAVRTVLSWRPEASLAGWAANDVHRGGPTISVRRSSKAMRLLGAVVDLTLYGVLATGYVLTLGFAAVTIWRTPSGQTDRSFCRQIENADRPWGAALPTTKVDRIVTGRASTRSRLEVVGWTPDRLDPSRGVLWLGVKPRLAAGLGTGAVGWGAAKVKPPRLAS